MDRRVVDKFWSEQDKIYSQIKEIGFDRYCQSLPNLEQAFRLEDRGLRCMDEGTPGGVHLAGSGILLDIATAERYLRAARIDGVYSHQECGAVKLYAGKENLDPEFADEYGQEWAKTIAEKLAVPYKGHIPISKMARPSGLHIARLAYYDATGEFDYSNVSDLPPGFIVSRKYLDGDYAKTELETAISIAFGSHGFGEKFSSSDPFWVGVLVDKGSGAIEAGDLINEVETVIAKYDGRVKVGVIEVKLSGEMVAVK